MMEQRHYLSNLGKDCTYNYQWMFDREVWRGAYLTKGILGGPIYMYLSPEQNIEKMKTKTYDLTHDPNYTADGEKFTTIENKGTFTTATTCVTDTQLEECFLDNLMYEDVPILAIDACRQTLKHSDAKERIIDHLKYRFDEIKEAIARGEFSVGGKHLSLREVITLQNMGYSVYSFGRDDTYTISWE